MTRAISLLLLFSCVSLLTFNAVSQVTIGSSLDPNRGTLLDLKEFENEESKQGGITANKGMMLPRVNLSSPDKLQPMYSYSDKNTTPSPDTEISHAGLVVYNTNQCAPWGSGVYIWDGSNWIGINANRAITSPKLMIGVDTLYIPSGMDARPSIAQSLTFEWKGTSPTFSAPQPELSGGLSFTNPRGWTPVSGSWDNSPAELSIWADDMTIEVVNANPWLTRQSKITVNIPENDCGEAFNKELYLNQTNYAILPSELNKPVKQIILKNTNRNDLKILSNVPWQVTAKAEGDAIMNDILGSYTTEVKDNVVSDGTSGIDENFTYQSTSALAGNRYKTANLTFKDPTGRANEYVVNIKQCQGTPDMAGVYLAGSATETTNGNAAWSGQVVYHPAKPNVYEAFYSADFGDAGRWMVTNLAATNYDGISHSKGRDLLYNKNTNNEFDKAYWAYPSSSDLQDDEEYRKNPFLGYLYTWDAATAGKGSIPSVAGTETDGREYFYTKTQEGANIKVYDGRYNRDKVGDPNSGWIGDQKEAGMKEWNGTGTRANDTQARRQGICPKGWHLPSDYEWTELEREIIRNTKKYATVQSNIDTGNGTELAKVTQAAVEIDKNGVKDTDLLRGTSHGQAVRDVCESNFTGTSNSPKNNGFAILLSGYGESGMAKGLGVDGMYWTSSVAHGEAAYGRIIGNNNSGIFRYKPHRYYQFPVRCKKDE